jgi:GntR family transcriptional repressor for pyruvate dehydrogenase complex
MLENLNKIELKNPVDLIISQIRDLISSGSIKPGEKLPPERKLADHLGVSRNQVREAIHKLQFYGIVKIQPQSGTVVSGIGIVALEGLMTDILKIEESDFKSLVDTRILLEKEAARLAAINRTEDDIEELTNALHTYEQKSAATGRAVEADLEFHIKIAEASKNSVLKSLMLIITPDIVKKFIQYDVCSVDKNRRTIAEHNEILEMIINKDSTGAIAAMDNHLSEIKKFHNNS